MLFKDFSIFWALEATLYGRAGLFVQFWWRHYGEHTCEIILNLDQLFMRCPLEKKFTDNIQDHICSP